MSRPTCEPHDNGQLPRNLQLNRTAGSGPRLVHHRPGRFLADINALHPFREGNGRAQRAFFGQLARDAGFPLAWQHLDPVRNVEASAAIMRGDPEPMRKMLDALVRDGI